MIPARIQSLLCLIILAIILVAGLTPFRRPKNAVTWLQNQNGLRFGRMGMLASEQSFDSHQGCSIEMWLKLEALRESGTLLVFSKPETPMQLWVRQYHNSLLVERWAGDAERQLGIIGIDDAFSQGRPVFLTIASGADRTSMYLNGHLIRTFPGFRPLDNCSGQLVVGSSTVSPDTMSGELYGLAVYQVELNTPRIAEHFESWTKLGHPELAESDAAAAVYLFNEHVGNIVHNSVRQALDLLIPNRFFLLHHQFLQAFWKENRTSRGYWKDILINVVGFMPLGFFFCSFFSSVRPNRHPILVTILLGFAVSLTIEVLQAYLPTRTSGTTDLITNTSGTFLGATLYGSRLAKAALTKLRKVSRQPIS
jgi:VanZ family protein